MVDPLTGALAQSLAVLAVVVNSACILRFGRGARMTTESGDRAT